MSKPRRTAAQRTGTSGSVTARRWAQNKRWHGGRASHCGNFCGKQSLFCGLQFRASVWKLKLVHKWLIVVYFVPLCKARKLCFEPNPMYEIKQAKISPGMRHLLPCILWHAVSDYKDFLYSPCFICHLFPIWTLWSPDLSDGSRARFMTRKAAVPLFLHMLAAHFWQEIDSISAANSWMR